MECPFGRGKPHYENGKVPISHKKYIGWFAAEHVGGNVTMQERTGLSKKTICKYAKVHKEGGNHTSGMGRQFDIGDSPARRVVQRVKEAVDEDRALDPVEVRELLIKAADESSRSRKKKISQEWVGNNIERLGLATKNGQDKPDARQEAERDLLNGLSTLTGFQLVADVVPDEALVINFDATQFMISGGKGGTLQVVVVKDEPLSGPISTKSKGGNELNFFIKWYSIISATGVPGPLVFMLACDSMGPDEFEVFEVRGLCKSDAAINDFGYIVFCATRSGNASFYKWLNIAVILPFIGTLREMLELDSSCKAVVVCDGEAVQIDPYQEPEVQRAYETSCVFMLKLCASTTAVSQPCDAWKLFSALKARVRSMLDEWKGQKFLERKIGIAMRQFGKLNARDKSRATKGLLMIRKAIGDHLRGSTILSSFQIVGLRPYSMLQILRQFHQEPTAGDLARTADEVKPMVQKLARLGQLADADLMRGYSMARDALNRGTLEPLARPKEDRSLHQRRVVLCLHKEVVVAELNRVDAAAQAAVDKANKTEDRKRKRQENEAAKRAKADENAAKKAAKDAKAVLNPPPAPPQ